ncbi:MAG TPA: hypothetical protein VN841_06385 [Bryobacteraceae bacterium]|nr:hypothetical protein [Bryobacteraceae bacterium]
MDSPRIPIHTGFYIQLKNGKAINPGGKDQEAVDLVASWISDNPSHPDLHMVLEWLQLKRQEVQESEEVHNRRAKRAELDALVDKTARGVGLRDETLLKLVREVTRDKYGLTTEE